VVACLLGRDHESIHDMALKVWQSRYRGVGLLALSNGLGRLWNVQTRGVAVKLMGLELRTHDVIGLQSLRMRASIVRFKRAMSLELN
jgi:hypothetical protein